nr:hypothetical protein HmN_000352100 [Hymenolepis microstoma]
MKYAFLHAIMRTRPLDTCLDRRLSSFVCRHRLRILLRLRYEASSSETQSSSYYGKVSKHIDTSHTRSKANGATFVGEVVKDGEDEGKVWGGNAAILKRSANTNDLRSQILHVTMSREVQYVQENHNLVFVDISELRINDQARTADVQPQILRLSSNAISQVGVRVTPKAIDLSRAE